MWYIHATSFVIFNIFWSSSGLLLINATSSIHRRQPIGSFVQLSFGPIFSFMISLLISSMRRAYWITDRTPPCLMLSFIWISLVFPCLVFSVAFRLLFSSFTSFQVGRSVPSFCMTYSIASSHALSYALVTSRNAMYASFLFCRETMFLCARVLCLQLWFGFVLWIPLVVYRFCWIVVGMCF